MPKLHTVLAIIADVKAKGETALTASYQRLGHVASVGGFTKRFRPKNEEVDVDPRPPEDMVVRCRVLDEVESVQSSLTRLFDVTATRDWGNCLAVADVVVAGNVLLTAVPATYLIWLEKKLVDLRTYVSKLPVLDPGQVWTYDEGNALYRTATTAVVSTKKVPKVLVLAVATDKHPAQTQVYTDDITVGYWDKTDLSGAIPATTRTALLNKVETLLEAVKVAREAANSTDVPNKAVGAEILGYIFG